MFRNIKKALAIACVTVAVGVVTVPNLVSAQNSAQDTTSRVKENKRGNGWKKLNLTDAQKEQMKNIRKNAKTQRQNVLTPEQRAKLEQARQSGDRKGVRKNLNLTDAQKQQMRAIGQTTKDQVKAILTPAQQQQLDQMKQERQSNRPNRGSK